MPRYTVNGAEVAVNPVTATSQATITPAGDVVAQVDKDALARQKAIEDAKRSGGGTPSSGSSSKLFIVGAGVVGLVAWAMLKNKKSKSAASTSTGS